MRAQFEVVIMRLSFLRSIRSQTIIDKEEAAEKGDMETHHLMRAAEVDLTQAIKSMAALRYHLEEKVRNE